MKKKIYKLIRLIILIFIMGLVIIPLKITMGAPVTVTNYVDNGAQDGRVNEEGGLDDSPEDFYVGDAGKVGMENFEERGFIGVGLGSIPTNAAIVSATLNFYVMNINYEPLFPYWLSLVDFGTEIDTNDFDSPGYICPDGVDIFVDFTNFEVSNTGWFSIPVTDAVQYALNNPKGWQLDGSDRWFQVEMRPDIPSDFDNTGDNIGIYGMEKAGSAPYLSITYDTSLSPPTFCSNCDLVVDITGFNPSAGCAGDTLTITGSGFGYGSPPVFVSDEIFTDDFEDNDLSKYEIKSFADIASGGAQINGSYSGRYTANAGDDAYIGKEIDATGYINVRVTFDFIKNAGGGQRGLLQYSTNNGVTYIDIDTFNGSGTMSETLPAAADGRDDLVVRWLSTGFIADHNIVIDDVEITGERWSDWAGVGTVTIGGSNASISYWDESQIQVIVPANVSGEISVTNICGSSDTENPGFTLSCGTLAISKSLSNITLNGSPISEPIPGSTLTYRIVYTNASTVVASNVLIKDAIPVGTIYVPGSLRIGTTSDTYADAGPSEDDAPGNDEASYDGTYVYFTPYNNNCPDPTDDNIPTGAAGSLWFQVIVTNLPAANSINNFAISTGENIGMMNSPTVITNVGTNYGGRMSFADDRTNFSGLATIWTMYITNKGNLNTTYTFSTNIVATSNSVPGDWTITFPDNNLTLAMGASTQFRVSVTPGGSVPSGAWIDFDIVADTGDNFATNYIGDDGVAYGGDIGKTNNNNVVPSMWGRICQQNNNTDGFPVRLRRIGMGVVLSLSKSISNIMLGGSAIAGPVPGSTVMYSVYYSNTGSIANNMIIYDRLPANSIYLSTTPWPGWEAQYAVIDPPDQNFLSANYTNMPLPVSSNVRWIRWTNSSPATETGLMIYSVIIK